MKIFVMVDMEGISGIVLSDQVMSGKEHYGAGRRYMTEDVNACVDGCFAGGASEVVVLDAHCTGYNLIFDELDPRANYIQGKGGAGCRMPGIDLCDGLILLGYHAMGGTPEAVLEHTMSSAAWQNFWINGKKAGEIAIDAAIAGEHGVPAIMVSGDDKACREARAWLKDAVTVEVKKGLAVEKAELLPKARAHEVIRGGAARAVRQCGRCRPLKIRPPVRLRLELVSRGRVPSPRSYRKVIDGRTFEIKAGSVEEGMSLL